MGLLLTHKKCSFRCGSSLQPQSCNLEFTAYLVVNSFKYTIVFIYFFLVNFIYLYALVLYCMSVTCVGLTKSITGPRCACKRCK